MPNYRYNMPEYERRNNCGGYSQPTMHRQHQTGRNRNASAEVCSLQPNSCETTRNSCEAPYREYRKEGEMSCAVNYTHDTLKDMPLAMAYVRWQRWQKIYDSENALCCGTIFEELNKPFRGMGGIC